MPDYKVIFTETVDYEVYFTTEEPLTLQQVAEESKGPDWFELMEAFRPEWRQDVHSVDDREISLLKELLTDRTERVLVECGLVHYKQFPEELG